MAKDILWFHALVWEGLLMANNLSLPNTIFAHGFFTVDGAKMSKTLGNVIDPLELVKLFGTDGTRYLVLSSSAFGEDGDISISKMKEKFNTDLANGLGNLVSRVAKLCEGVNVRIKNVAFNNLPFDEDAKNIIESLRPDEAIKVIWSRIKKLDGQINQDGVWKSSGAELEDKLSLYVNEIILITRSLYPFMPKTAKKIYKIFSSKKGIVKPESLFLRIK